MGLRDGDAGGLGLGIGEGPSNLGAPGEGGDLFNRFKLAKLYFGLLDDANDSPAISGEVVASKLGRAECGGVVSCSSASASIDEMDASFDVVGEMTGISGTVSLVVSIKLILRAEGMGFLERGPVKTFI